MDGYMGKILRVNLTKREFQEEQEKIRATSDLIENLIGENPKAQAIFLELVNELK